MKKTLLSLFIALTAVVNAHAQFSTSVLPVTCTSPVADTYLVDPSQPVRIYVEDAGGVDQSVTWSPITNLYTDIALTTPYTAGTPVQDVYFGGAEPYQTYAYTGTHPGGSTQVNLVNGGFTYDQFCSGDADTLADIDILAIPDGNLTWYDDAGGVTTLPNTTPLQSNATYYVDLGLAGCSELFPVLVKNVSVTVTPSVCSDPAAEIYMVGSAPSNQLYIEDENGVKLPVTWTPATNLYTDAALTIPYVAGTPATDVYFDSANAGANQTFVYTGTYLQPTCTTTESIDITLVNDGFTHGTYCSGDLLSDIDILGIPDTELVWYYDDGSGVLISVPANTPVEDNATYYVSLGLPGCSGEVFPVIVDRATPTVTPTICADPEKNIYIVDPAQVSNFYIEDENGVKLNVTWTPATDLFTDAALTTPYVAGTPVADVYYGNGSSQTFTGSYQLPGCTTTETVDITVVPVNFNFTYENYCAGDVLNDIDILGLPDGDITWYDAAGAPLPGTTPVVENTTYQVALDLGAGCTQLFPVFVEDRVVLSISPMLCSNPATGVYIVNPSTDVLITLNDPDGNPIVDVSWAPVDHLYAAPGKQFGLPSTMPYTGDVYFNSDIPNQVNNYLATYSLPGCSSDQTTQITIVTAGFEYNDLCFNSTETLNDIDILGIPPADLTWYSDAAGNTPIPNNTPLVAGDPYFVDLGFPGCTQVFPVEVNYKTPLPTGSGVYNFCTQATWVGANFNNKDGGQLDELSICGANLTYYANADGTGILSGSTDLVDLATYYVSQTINGCESGLLAVTVDEQECACFENPTFEDTTLQSYTFKADGLPSNFTDCNRGMFNVTTVVTPGAVDDLDADFAPVTGGFDPVLEYYGIDRSKTSPGGCSEYALRLGNTGRAGTVGSSHDNSMVSMEADFIAGEVFSFDYTLILEEAGLGTPSGHFATDENPFFYVRIFDQSGALVQERCIVSYGQGCVFQEVSIVNPPGATDPSVDVVYSEWSCIKLNTTDIQGQPATVEFFLADCGRGGHWGYGYIDNIFVGDNEDSPCSDSSFGYVDVNPVQTAGQDDYAACSFVRPPTNSPECEPELSVINPQFPITVCGSYDEPVNAQGDSDYKGIELNIVHNGATVLTLINPAVNGNNYCFTINSGDIPGGPPYYGLYTIIVGAEFNPGCGGVTSLIVDNVSNGFKFCPTAGCPTPFKFCAGPSSPPPPTLDLTTKKPEILNNIPALEYPNYDITFHYGEPAAQAGTGAITSETNFPTPTSSTTLFVRVEFDYAVIGGAPIADCYDVVPLEIIIGTAPNVPATLPSIGSIGCVDAAGEGNFDLTQVYGAVTASVNPADVIVTYHNLQSDADLGIDAILPPIDANYPGINGDTIFVRTENILDGCYAITTFTLQGNQLLYNAPTTHTVCDQDTNPTDAITDVNLSDVSDQIDGNGTYNVALTYYLSQNEAQTGVGTPLATTGWNTGDVASVWVRIEDPNDAVCFKVEEFMIDVVPAPAVFGQSLFGCSGAGGSFNFDLTDPALLNGITGGVAGVTVASFHTTFANADNNVAPIPALQLPNYSSTGGTVFARVVNASCHNVATVALNVGALPNVETPANIPDYELCDDGDGTVEFDLTTMKDPIITDPNLGDYTVTYYASQVNIPGTPITSETAYPSSSPTAQIFVVVTNTANGCTAQTSFNIMVNPLPTFNTIVSLEECDQGTQDGITQFDLTEAETLISTGSGTITFYDTQPKADAGTPGTEIPTGTLYTNNVDGQIIYVRIEDGATGCFDTTTFILDAIPAPIVTAPPAYEVCDGDDGSIDGNATFNLPTLDAAITGGVGGVTVTYHPDQASADAGTPTVPTPASFSSPSTTIVARVTENSPSGCYNTVDVVLTVLDSPLLPATITPLELCDPEGDNIEIFNLTDAEIDIRANEAGAPSAPWTVTYYATVNDRNNGGPTVPDETQFPNDAATPTQPVYFRVTGANGCITDGQFNIVVNSLPGVNTPDPRIICGDGSGAGIATFNLNDATTQITGNNPNFTVTYYELETDADAGVPGTEIPSTDLDNYQNDDPYTDSVWIRIVDTATGCVVVLQVPLEVKQAPIANTPLPYEVCDPDNDGKHIFNLPSLDLEITGGVAGVTVSYHETQPNAENDVIDITTPGAFANTMNGGQTIFARVESQGIDCYVVVPVVLVVEPSPQPVLPQNLPPLMGCDENGDGQYQFNLTQMEVLIEANEANPNDFDLEYYSDPANIPANPITTPSGYVSGNDTILVVVTGPNDCTKQTSFEIIVNPLPVITTPQPLELCDVNNPGDEEEVFDLTDATLDITMGDASINISYWKSQGAADIGDTNSPDYIGNPGAYTNTVNNETIYIRAEDTDTGCVVTQGYTLTLIVNPLPSPELPTESFKICDADNDGFVEFDFEDIIPVIQNGEPDVAITFHLGPQDAENGVGAIPITQPFQLTSAGSQIIYVRAENTITGCYVTGPIELEVVPSPEIINLEDLYVCDDATPNGFAMFNLLENTPRVLGGQDPTIHEVTYYTSQQDAEDGIDAIDMPAAYTNISNPQTIYVRIENTDTGCIDTFDFADDNSFQLFVEELPVVNDPTPLAICDDDYGTNPVEQAVFDLTVKEAEITGQTVPPSDYEFTYYANEQDFQNGVAITDPTAYQNVDNPQTIYITVVNGDTQNLCEDYTELTITVLPLPSPSETDQEVLRLEQCDDDNDGVAADPFDLRQSGNLIAGGENVDLHYYKTERAAREGDTNSAEYITTPDAYTNEPSYNTINSQGMEVQVIYVRVESGAAGNFCFVLAQFEIRVIPAPVLNDINPFGYTLCEDGSSGSAALFTEDIARNLYDASVATPDPSVIVPLLDQIENSDLELDNYTIHYYSDAMGTMPFVSGTTASTGDEIFVQVEYDETGCTSLVGRIIITVEPRPVIPGTDLIREVCSDEPGGTTATIDLTQFDVDVNPGAPADTEVVYYENMNAYNNGDAPIDTPSAYTTVENPQEIIAVVRDVNTLCESLDYSTILIEVNPSPMVDLSMYDGMVICVDKNPLTPVEGGDYQPIVLETGLDETLYTFEWSLDGTILSEDGPSLLVTQAGTYTVTVTDVSSSVNTSCTTTSSATIIESNPPEFEVEVLTESFSEEHTITITNVTGAGDYEFSIDQGPWMDLGEDGTLTFTGIGAGVHAVYGRDKNGCGTTLVEVSIIDYPKFFTPNADGYNDTWNIIGIDGQPNAQIYIFDRYGKLLKQLSPTGPGWDGTYNGRPMPSSDYWFRVEYIEPMTETPATFKANFTLKR